MLCIKTAVKYAIIERETGSIGIGKAYSLLNGRCQGYYKYLQRNRTGNSLSAIRRFSNNCIHLIDMYIFPSTIHLTNQSNISNAPLVHCLLHHTPKEIISFYMKNL